MASSSCPKANAERLCRLLRTLLFMLTMFASLLVASVPVLISITDVTVCLAVAAVLVKRAPLVSYTFGTSLMDVPLLSILRSVVIMCVYCCCDGPGICEGLYVGAAMVCCLASVVFLTVKACVFAPVAEIYGEGLQLGAPEKSDANETWAMPVVFVCSLVFALGHVVVAYRTSCRARRKLLFHRVDPESVLACNVFSSYKVPRSPTPSYGKYSKSDDEMKRGVVHDQKDLPISFLADIDSLFLVCQGLTVHYKLSLFESPTRSLASSPFHGSSPNCSPRSISSTKLKFERPFIIPPKVQNHLDRSFSDNINPSLYAPLLAEVGAPPTYLTDEISVLCLDDSSSGACSPNSFGFGAEDSGKVAVVLIHGFGGGVFSWRHVMSTMARQIGCPVVAFDRPGWGLTSRPRRKDWEDKHMSNPYNLDSQVDLLISFCSELGFSSVILVGHDDGGLLALKVAEKVRTSANSYHVDIKGVVLLSTSLSREVVPAFARILLHTSLGKKHMVRPLLRAEITQVINRHAWFDATKLTAEILALYKAPLYVEGWDEALHEIGRFSFATVLSPQNAATLLKSVEDLPILVVTGAEDALVPFKSAQAMASKLVNSRLVAISGCGHLPHEECPKALLAALTPFITRLLSTQDTSQKL